MENSVKKMSLAAILIRIVFAILFVCSGVLIGLGYLKIFNDFSYYNDIWTSASLFNCLTFNKVVFSKVDDLMYTPEIVVQSIVILGLAILCCAGSAITSIIYKPSKKKLPTFIYLALHIVLCVCSVILCIVLRNAYHFVDAFIMAGMITMIVITVLKILQIIAINFINKPRKAINKTENKEVVSEEPQRVVKENFIFDKVNVIFACLFIVFGILGIVLGVLNYSLPQYIMTIENSQTNEVFKFANVYYIHSLPIIISSLFLVLGIVSLVLELVVCSKKYFFRKRLWPIISVLSAIVLSIFTLLSFKTEIYVDRNTHQIPVNIIMGIGLLVVLSITLILYLLKKIKSENAMFISFVSILFSFAFISFGRDNIIDYYFVINPYDVGYGQYFFNTGYFNILIAIFFGVILCTALLKNKNYLRNASIIACALVIIITIFTYVNPSYNEVLLPIFSIISINAMSLVVVLSIFRKKIPIYIISGVLIVACFVASRVLLSRTEAYQQVILPHNAIHNLLLLLTVVSAIVTLLFFKKEDKRSRITLLITVILILSTSISSIFRYVVQNNLTLNPNLDNPYYFSIRFNNIFDLLMIAIATIPVLAWKYSESSYSYKNEDIIKSNLYRNLGIGSLFVVPLVSFICLLISNEIMERYFFDPIAAPICLTIVGIIVVIGYFVNNPKKELPIKALSIYFFACLLSIAITNFVFKIIVVGYEDAHVSKGLDIFGLVIYSLLIVYSTLMIILSFVINDNKKRQNMIFSGIIVMLAIPVLFDLITYSIVTVKVTPYMDPYNINFALVAGLCIFVVIGLFTKNRKIYSTALALIAMSSFFSIINALFIKTKYVENSITTAYSGLALGLAAISLILISEKVELKPVFIPRPKRPAPVVSQPSEPVQRVIPKLEGDPHFKYVGTIKLLVIETIKLILISSVTCFIYFPWAFVKYTKKILPYVVHPQGLKIRINFSGTQLFLKCLIWGLLVSVTFGIYGLFIIDKVLIYVFENSSVVSKDGKIHKFAPRSHNGGIIWRIIVYSLLLTISLGFAAPYALTDFLALIVDNYARIPSLSVRNRLRLHSIEERENYVEFSTKNRILTIFTFGLYAPQAIKKEFNYLSTFVDIQEKADE